MIKHCLWVCGWGTSARIFEDLKQKLPQYIHHDIDFTSCRSISDLKSVVMASMQAQNDEESAVIGWSMGGMLVLEALFGLQRSSQAYAGKVIVVSSTLQFTNEDSQFGWPPRVLNRMIRRLRRDREGTLADFKARLLPDESSAVVQRASGLLQPCDFFDEGLAAGLLYLYETDLREDWNHFVQENHHHPALLWLHGRLDEICPAAAIPQKGLTYTHTRSILEQGHIPFLTAPDECLKLIAAFLQGGERPDESSR